MPALVEIRAECHFAENPRLPWHHLVLWYLSIDFKIVVCGLDSILARRWINAMLVGHPIRCGGGGGWWWDWWVVVLGGVGHGGGGVMVVGRGGRGGRE